LDLREQVIEVAEVRHIASDAGHICPDLLHRRRQLGVTPARDEDVRAFLDELPRGCEADAAVATRNQRDLSLKLCHDPQPFLPPLGSSLRRMRACAAKTCWTKGSSAPSRGARIAKTFRCTRPPSP